MGQNARETRQNHADTGQTAFHRAHGTLLQVATRRGKKIQIPCPHCRRRAADRYWHAELERGICDRCWRELEHDRLPAVLT